MSAALTRVVISVRALEPALAFYRDLLGLPAELTPGFAMLTAGNGVEVFLHAHAVQLARAVDVEGLRHRLGPEARVVLALRVLDRVDRRAYRTR